jgi:hypothetical protein
MAAAPCTLPYEEIDIISAMANVTSITPVPTTSTGSGMHHHSNTSASITLGGHNGMVKGGSYV